MTTLDVVYANLQTGKRGTCFTIMNDRGYRFVAYPGPNVVDDKGRAEHKPLHFHIKRNNGKELRIILDDFSEMNGYSIPKPVKIILSIDEIAEAIRVQTKSIYETGKPIPAGYLKDFSK